jgi:hypothetical protein
MTTERLTVIRQLIEFNRPVSECSDRLRQYGWDYEGGARVILTKDQIKAVLGRYIEGEPSQSDLEQ